MPSSALVAPAKTASRDLARRAIERNADWIARSSRLAPEVAVSTLACWESVAEEVGQRVWAKTAHFQMYQYLNAVS